MPVQQPEAVCDWRGKIIGTVTLVKLGRGGRPFWQARSLDGIDLGAHVRRIEAEEAIQDDWEAGRPRSPRSVSEKYRPLWESEPPIFLGGNVANVTGVNRLDTSKLA